MMIRKLFFVLFVFLFSAYCAESQEYSRSIEWSDKMENINGEAVYYFRGALYSEENNEIIPYYFERISLSDNTGNAFAKIIKSEYKEIDNPNFKIDGLEKMEIVKTSIGIEKKSPFLYLTILPFRKNSSTGKIEKLISFTFIIEEKTKDINIVKKCLKTYVNNSVLSSGKWVKIKIKTDGIYKLTYEDLVGFGFSNPAEIKLFGNGGVMLSEMNNVPRNDDLVENPVYMEKGADGVFNAGDYILFYGKATSVWNFDTITKAYTHKIHNFSEVAYYFLTTDVGAGKKIQSTDNSGLSANNTVTTFDDHQYYEKELYNLIQSGSLWVGEYFNNQTSFDFDFSFPDIVSSIPVKLKTSLLARSSVTSSFNISVNDNLLSSVAIGEVDMGNYTATYAKVQEPINDIVNPSSNIKVTLDYIKPNSSSEGWLNFIEIVAKRNLKINTSQFQFRNGDFIQDGGVSEYQLQNVQTNIKIWDVTNFLEPVNEVFTKIGSMVTFKSGSDLLHEFIAFDGSTYLAPEYVGTVENQNLHGLAQKDLVIVSNPLFLSYANTLANLHQTKDNLSVVVVTPEQVYNEFSSGNPDVSAIRDFMKMFYDRSTGPDDMPKYLMLVGDGSYDNRSATAENTNFILTYQSSNSLKPTDSFVTDDFFALLDDDEGGWVGYMDIGVGRLPVKNVSEAQAVVNKIVRYEDAVSQGDWRNVLCFIADDEDSNQHMLQSNSMAEKIDTLYPAFNIEKIFLDAYPQISTPAGQRYPDVNQAFNDRVRKGALVINYTGHGNEVGLAHEHITGVSEINSWDNEEKLPLFVTATCEFSRFDDFERTSAGEQVLLNPNGGGVALLTTTRLVYSTPNFILNDNFYDYVFTRDADGNHLSLGEVMRLTKVSSGTGINKRNFTLLGDPALKLAIPNYDVKTTMINNTPVTQPNDTLKALTKITVTGYVTDISGNKLSSYNGIIYPTVFDKSELISTLANDGGAVFQFYNQKNILYKGKASVENGDFTFSFIVPKDINYNYGFGKISYYFDDGQSDGNGYFKKIVIGGTADSFEEDEDGPRIELFMNDENFVFGGITDQSPKFLAFVADSNGINTASGIGHDITAVLDGQTNNIIVLNDYYEAELNSYQRGTVSYPLSELSNGLHNIKFKVWDVYNNSAEAYIEFIVAESSELVLSHIFNYPNPFTTSTDFYFDHNFPGNNLQVLIQIFSVSGKLVKTIDQDVYSNGFRSQPIHWDGLDDFGSKIGRGVYIYRVKVKAEDGQQVQKFEKLVILR